jgi:DNA repair protein RecO (recombination protein O)
MSLVVTDAIVLHAFDYLESSRIFKLVTREAGVRSVLARGARRSKRRFGAALDLFAQGSAELQVKIGRELDTLSAFDVVRARPQLASHMSRFTGANAVAELVLRFARDAADPALFDVVMDGLDAIAAAPLDRIRDVTLAAAWSILVELGIAPTIDACAECHAAVDQNGPAMFSHPAGGVLCPRCAHLARSGRMLPPDARAALRDWISRRDHPLGDANEIRAHQRLLREFVREHLADERALRAFDVWERDTWSLGADAVRAGGGR